MNKDHLTAALRELFLLESRESDHVWEKYKKSLSHFGVREAIKSSLQANPNLLWSEIETLMRTIMGDSYHEDAVPADETPLKIEDVEVCPSHENYTFTVEEWVLSQGVTAHVDLINFGKAVAEAYRRVRTEDPIRALRKINNLDIKVNVYQAADVDIIRVTAMRFMPKNWKIVHGPLFEKSSLQADSLRD